MRIGRTLRALLAGVALTTAATGAAAQAIQIEASRDTTLIEDASGSWSNGSGPAIFAGTVSQGTLRRALIAFDLEGALPEGAVILSAQIILYMNQTSGGPAMVGLHRVSAEWGEGDSSAGGGGGAPSEEGDATWIHTFFDTGFWAGAGGDVIASSASMRIDQPGRYRIGPTTAMVEDVRGWVADPASNHGWMLRGDESELTTSKRFASREHPDRGTRPVLVIEYVVDERPVDEDELDDDEDTDSGPRRHRGARRDADG